MLGSGVTGPNSLGAGSRSDDRVERSRRPYSCGNSSRNAKPERHLTNASHQSARHATLWVIPSLISRPPVECGEGTLLVVVVGRVSQIES